MKAKAKAKQKNLSLSNAQTADLAHSDFLAYITTMVPNYEIGRHHWVIAKYLEAVERGEINRLMIFLPPRAGKTMLVSELFPSWYMGRNPTEEIIATTYSGDRAKDTGRKVRNHMIDERFSSVFPNCEVSADTKSSSKIATKTDGAYVSVGVGGPITGRGAHLFLIDDPLRGRKEAESKTLRNDLIVWFKGVAYMRLMGKNAIIIITTRWHFADLSGWLLKERANENWTVLSLPAIAASDDDIIGRKVGDPLWPENPIFTKERLANTKVTVGTREWNAQFQQRPLPGEGGAVNLNWFNYYEPHELPKFKWIVISVDTAFKEAEVNDPSAFTVWGFDGKDHYLLYVYKKQMGFPKLLKKTKEIHKKFDSEFRGHVRVLVEDKGSGTSLIQTLKDSTSIPVIGYIPKTRKQLRMEDVSPLIEAGRVYLPKQARWLVDYETEMAEFPLGEHDDQADSTSQYLLWTKKRKWKRSGAKYYK